MGLPRLPPLWQSARWQLAWHDRGCRLHPLGGCLRRFEVRLAAMISWFHDLIPPSSLSSICILSCVAVSLHLRYAMDPSSTAATPEMKGFSYYVLLSRSVLPPFANLIYSLFLLPRSTISLIIYTYSFTLPSHLMYPVEPFFFSRTRSP